MIYLLSLRIYTYYININMIMTFLERMFDGYYVQDAAITYDGNVLQSTAYYPSGVLPKLLATTSMVAN